MARRKSKKGADKRHNAPRTAAKAFGAYQLAGVLAGAGTGFGLSRRAVQGRGGTPFTAARTGQRVGTAVGLGAAGAVAARGYRKRKKVKAGKGGPTRRQRRDSKGKFK
jgi:hypothetical protein